MSLNKKEENTFRSKIESFLNVVRVERRKEEKQMEMSIESDKTGAATLGKVARDRETFVVSSWGRQKYYVRLWLLSC